MADSDECAFVVNEFQQWFERHQSTGQSSDVILFLQEHHRSKDGATRMEMAFSDDSTFTIVCPFEYPHGKNLLFDVRSSNDRLKKDWLPKIRTFAADNRGQVKLPGILSKCVEYHRICSAPPTSKPAAVSSPEQDSDFEDEIPEGIASGPSTDCEVEDLLYGDDNFTTMWDIEMDFLKKRWLVKEEEMRSKIAAESLFNADAPSPSTVSASTTPKTPITVDVGSPVPKKSKYDDKGAVPKAGRQIFEHESAAFQILSNEMIALLKAAKNETLHGGQPHFACEAVADSLYRWRVKVGAFPDEHPLHNELDSLKAKFGYDTIELQLDFVPEFPFYPPLLRLVRPRLKGSLVQSLANIDILKLTFWNPAKSVHDVLKQIKDILLKHARLDVGNERNDKEKYTEGAYLPLEDHLIKLALATEVRPRANFDIITVENLEKAPELRSKAKDPAKPDSGQKLGGWRAGIGYGSGNRLSGWNPESYVIAQQEKDKQILEILKNIAHEIAGLAFLSKETTEVYSVVEGSCLLPLLEQQLSVGSFIEIDRHLELYQLVLEVVDSIGKVSYLLPLLCNVPRQKLCIMAYLANLQSSASQYIECVNIKTKAVGAKPKQPKGAKAQTAEAKTTLFECDDADKKAREDQELGNATKIIELFSKLKKKLADAKLTFSMEEQPVDKADSTADAKANANQSLAQCYARMLKPLQFASIDMSLSGQSAHKYAENAADKLSKETRTIWKEWTALKTSLPLNLDSSVFVRVDESHMNLLQALIIGPEGTPYANGCFVFDMCFPTSYPAKAPLVRLRTTGGGRVRFNPNLYNCGKVCLSLLGTWSGDSGESWNAKTSTLLQVLVSIQSLILVDEPYFNEPGYEKTIGTEDGKKHSEKYNKDVRANCVRYAMLENLQQPQPGFEEVIRLHYQVKKVVVMKQMDDWLRMDHDNRQLKADVDRMKKLLADLPTIH